MIGILTNGPRVWPSSRFRGWWLEDIAPDTFRCYGPLDTHLEGLAECDAVVFQKRQSGMDIQAALRMKEAGKAVIYDITDPVWWWEPRAAEDMIRIADCVVCSNPGLAQAVSAMPFVQRVEMIPDRMLPAYHPNTAQHGERERPVMVWFGSNGNRIPTLVGVLPLLGYVAHEIPFTLRVIDGMSHLQLSVEDMPQIKLEYVPWTLETFHAQLAAADIAICPPYPGPWGTMKSNNKLVTAWWAGLPTITGYDFAEMLELLSNSDKRQETGQAMRKVAEAEYDIASSATEYQELAGELLK